MSPPARNGRRLHRTGPRHGFCETDDPGDIQIIDSWLVSDGAARGLELHAGRFSSACADMYAVRVAETMAFLRAAVARIPTRGRWFPRVELALVAGMPRHQLWIRSAPPARETVRLWLGQEPDRRSRPDVKGIDLDHLALLRRRALDAGGDDALIVSEDGRVLEGSSTSILWWRGDVLCAPPAGPQVLGGVRRSLLVNAVAGAGGEVAFECVPPGELDGLEVWAVNALHGIRPVAGWIGAPFRPGPARRARRWNARLGELVRADCGRRTNGHCSQPIRTEDGADGDA